MNRKRQILIVGHFGRHNTGDSAMLWATLIELDKIYKNDVSFAILAFKSHLLPGLPREMTIISYSITEVMRAIMTSTAIVLPIGTSIQDFTGSLRYLKVLLLYLAICIIARVYRIPTCFLGVGIGPLTRIWGRTLSRALLNCATFISVRDSQSYELAKELDVNDDKIVVGFDLAACLPLNKKDKGECSCEYLGISLLPFFEIYHDNPSADSELVESIADALLRWLDDDVSHCVKIFVFRGGDRHGDYDISKKFADLLGNRDRVKIAPYTDDPLKVIEQMNVCKMFVVMRYHANVLAYSLEIPFLMIDYHPKCAALAKTIGLPDECKISIYDVKKEFASTFVRFVSRCGRVEPALDVVEAKKRIRHMMREYQKKMPA